MGLRDHLIYTIYHSEGNLLWLAEGNSGFYFTHALLDIKG